MKRASWYLAAGAAAGFAGVLGLHGGGPAAPSLPGQPEARGASPAAGPAGGAGAGSATGPVRQVTGNVVQYGYGELAVTVTVRGTEVTAVSVPVLRTAEPFSQQLAQQAIPMLRSEVLAAHGPRIQGVSGATYTSEAYAQSIQSALDKLHIK